MPFSRKLMCLIEGDASDLKELIAKEREHTLKDVDPHTLELWKVNIDLETHNEESVSLLRPGTNNGAEKLTWFTTMSKYWPHQPLTDCLHIIVKIAGTVPVPDKTPCELDCEAVLAKAQGRPAPSAGAKLDKQQDFQEPIHEDAIYNHRPLSLSAESIMIYHCLHRFVNDISAPPDSLNYTHGVLDIDDDGMAEDLKESIRTKKQLAVDVDQLVVPVSRSEEKGIDHEKLRNKRQNPLLPRMTLTELFSQPPLLADSYIVAELPGRKRKRDDPVDVSQTLVDLWTAPVHRDIPLLRAYLDEPLSQDLKSQSAWKLLLDKRAGDFACSDRDLGWVFKQCDDEIAMDIQVILTTAIMGNAPPETGTEDSFHGFWDANLRNILFECLKCKAIRNSNQGTATGSFRPDFGVLLTDNCVFRGEVTRVSFSGEHPKEELRIKTKWVYDPAPYILGYHAVGPVVVLAAILPQGGSVRVVDLLRSDLSSRRERIKNASRMIKMCGILQCLGSIIGEGKDRDMNLRFRDGGKTLEFFPSFVRKSYGSYGTEGEVQGEERVEHLRAIYAALVSKRVPNVDRLKEFKIRHPAHGSYVDLEPRGEDHSPESPTDVRNAVMCILETLKACHADPPIFHRDIRWPNVVRNPKDRTNWFLIDWEDASFAPTKAAPHMNRAQHSPKVFESGHSAEVDTWGVGQLMVTAPMRIRAIEVLGLKMMRSDVLNAEQALKDIQVVV